MDPDATLAEIRDILKNQRPRESAERLRELIRSLDEWLSKRGYLPQAWGGYDQHAQRPYGVKP